MIAGFNLIALDQDTGMDLYDPWISALGFFNAGGVIFGGASQESIPDVNHSMGKSVFETIDALWKISK